VDVVTVPGEYESGSFEHETSLGALTRRVLRREAAGPTVILMHEAPGLSESLFKVAGVFASSGYRMVLPVLLDAQWNGPGRRQQLASVIKICVARELSALSAGKTGAIVEWLRGLADEEFRATGGRPVGVIGMCLSGGFALGVITNQHVGAAVMSQPALPFRLPFMGSDLGVSKEDLRAIQGRVGRGGCIRAMRFSRDRRSPRARLDLIRRQFPDAECREIETSDRALHSVLARAVEAPDDSPLGGVLRDTIAFLDRHLKPSAEPAAEPTA
jgi:dienelactone hydrolase